jgi:predicted nucleic acid-binding protein
VIVLVDTDVLIDVALDRAPHAQSAGELLDLVGFVDVAPASAESVRHAARLPLKDFEDALQVAAALACRAEVIATRNLRDYRGAPVPAASPEDVLRSLGASE